MFFGSDNVFLHFWGLLLTVFKSFYLATFLLRNKTLQCIQAILKISTMAKPHGGAPPLLYIRPPPSAVQLMWEAFHTWLHQHVPPPPLEATPPPLIIWALVEAWELHCMKLLRTLYWLLPLWSQTLTPYLGVLMISIFLTKTKTALTQY